MADQEKTEEATQHRRDQAREKGQIPKSQDLVSAVMLIVALGALMYLGRDVIEFLGQFTRDELGTVPPLNPSELWATHHTATTFYRLAMVMVPVLIVLFIAGIVINMAQTGIMFLPDKLGFDWNRINPMSGFQRLFSLTNLMKLIFGIGKVLIVSIVAGVTIWFEMDEILGLSALSTIEVATYLLDTALWTAMKIAVCLVILALLDYGYQLWKSEQDLMMTKEEIREEVKSMQGDPQVLARRRQVARQLAMSRMANDVPKADVVVTNPTELAIALKYDPYEMSAPVVVAKGAGSVAQRIRRLALENNIPVVERKELARALYAEAELGRPIPAERYAAVAEVLRYVYDLQGKQMPTMSDLERVDRERGRAA
ncbi:flagellar biosynthesis protein FlhB [Bremerella cremea]|uniref:Flagellar biosynthetic protein FlhB n=1 Tax=Blastopirellula marina TaxID=124 RepID=A0A2S8FRL9_9BACT|nr:MULTISPECIES: flagellar biosynthesis protein FlhB [Pirellulaceae]PQO34823.1 flagellar biosynthesis protein FlhB [Blastopirellula marina]RCS47323.1 flagellar biosynthesis protein FlhB [Bremerella cremea]